MKRTILYISFLIPTICNAQWPNRSDCGTWKQLNPVLSEWKDIDTLGSKPVTTTERFYIQAEWEATEFIGLTYAVYCKCGCGYPDVRRQRRICTLTGIVQERTETISYKYVPKQPSLYQQTIDNFKK